MMQIRRTSAFALLAFAAACAQVPPASEASGYGSDPALPEPDHALIPTVNIAPAIGWPQGRMPVAAEGLRVTAFAQDLDHPRWLHVLPNGDVLVAETNAPKRPEDSDGLKGWIMGKLMKRAGAATTASANRIRLLRDTDDDGVADLSEILIEGLYSPFGMALANRRLYVANTDAVVSFPYAPGQIRVSAAPTPVVNLPAGPLNHHWTKNLIASADGSRLYVAIGSNSNVGENGLDKEEGRAAIWEIDLRNGDHRIYATGLRNPVGMAWEPQTRALWVAVNERDEIGDDLVPDYITAVRDGGFYGWPYSYFGQHVDERVEPQRPELVRGAIVPDYALGAHTASLGLAWSGSRALPERLREGMFIGQHGSWNRSSLAGYKVIFVPFEDGRPIEAPVDVLTGFLGAEGEAYGRPVGVAMDRSGALLVADDVGNTVWRVSAAES